MDLQLKEKTAFVSGSTSGIGFAVAKSLLQEGAHVIINGRKTKKIDEAVSSLQQETGLDTASGLQADFSDTASIAALLQNLPEIDILINNMGIYRAKSFLETTDKDWNEQFDVNVMSGVRLSRHCLPKMLARNWGRILFVSSECATLVPPDLIAYSVTKTAILSVSRGLAQLTKGSGVTVNSVVPGSTLSEGAEKFLEAAALKQGKTISEVEANFFKETRTSSLLQRFASVEEVAHTITYMASPLSAATNGAAIKIDGGSMGGIL
ncbi:SDR family oxidoreductase [Flavobacteriaceae bacterium 3-367]